MALNRTHIFLDEPAESDEFGAHSRIANLIYDEIVASENGYSIALIGDWGSGKSTVVRLLQGEALKQRSPGSSAVVRIFLYDAWAHQGDPLRRSFIDDFNAFLRKNNLRTEEQAKATNEEIWNRLEETTTTTEPIILRHAKLLILSGFLVPIGMKLIDVPSGMEMEFSMTTLAALSTARNILGAFLTMLPVVLGLFLWGILKVSPACVKTFLFGPNYRSKHFGITSFLAEKVHGKAEKKTIRTPNDSIIEFKRIFFELIASAQDREPRVRLVLVLDNIDRLPADQARQFWSTMQTFFDDDAARRVKAPKYWFVAPFSKRALANVFRDSSEAANEKSASENKEMETRSTTAYIERVFQTAFYVPPLILSDWRRYFLNNLRKAFPENPEGDLQDVCDLYDIVKTRAPAPINPRELKLFINALVMLYRQRGDDVSLQAMAAFILHQEAIDGRGEGIIEPNFLRPEEIELIGSPDWQSLFGGLYFGVSAEMGLQLLLRNRILLLLRDGRGDELQKEEERFGFYDVLPNVIRSDLAGGEADGQKLTLIASVLAGLRGAGNEAMRGVWFALRERLRTVKSWKAFEQPLASGIDALFKYTPDDQQTSFAQAIAESFSGAEVPDRPLSEVVPDVRAENWAAAAVAILRNVREPEKIGISAPGSPQFALQVFDALAAYPESLVQKQQIKFTQNLSMGLAASLNAGHTLRDPAEFVKLVKLKSTSIKWSVVIPPLKERLQVTDLSVEVCTAHTILLLAIYSLAPDEAALAAIQELSVQSFLPHLMGLHNGNIRAKAILILATLIANPAYQRGRPHLQSPTGDAAWTEFVQKPSGDPKLLVEISNLAVTLNLTDAIVRIGAAQAGVAEASIQILDHLIKDGHVFVIPPREFIDRYQFWFTAEKTFSPAVLIRQLAAKDALLQQLIDDAFLIDSARLYIWALDYALDAKRQDYVDFLRDGIQQLPKEIWQAVLAETGKHGDLMALIRQLTQHGSPLNLITSVSDSLRDRLRDLTAAGKLDTVAVDRWREIFSLLRSGTKTTLIADVTEDMYTSEIATIRCAIAIVGDQISTPVLTQAGPDRVARRIFSAILKSPEVETVEWLTSIFTADPRFMSSLSGDVVEDLKSRFAESVDANSANGDLAPVLARLGDVAGLAVQQERRGEEGEAGHEG